MSTQPEALRLAELLEFESEVAESCGGQGAETTKVKAESAAQLRAQHELIQTLKAAIKTGVDLVHSDVIRVRPSERQKLIDALTDWPSALASAEAHK